MVSLVIWALTLLFPNVKKGLGLPIEYLGEVCLRVQQVQVVVLGAYKNLLYFCLHLLF